MNLAVAGHGGRVVDWFRGLRRLAPRAPLGVEDPEPTVGVVFYATEDVEPTVDFDGGRLRPPGGCVGAAFPRNCERAAILGRRGVGGFLGVSRGRLPRPIESLTASDAGETHGGPTNEPSPIAAHVRDYRTTARKVSRVAGRLSPRSSVICVAFVVGAMTNPASVLLAGATGDTGHQVLRVLPTESNTVRRETLADSEVRAPTRWSSATS